MKTAINLSNEQLESLRMQMRGRVLTGNDPGYEQACELYIGMIHKCPAIIVQCRNSGDVITSVNFARENGLLLAIRSGGHSGPGFGLCDDGLVIDLSGMNGIRVDPDSKTVRVEGGCTWGEVDHATNAFGMATPSGLISTTGVGGLTLGGGLGYLSRKYGLTIDNLLEADVVLADGNFVTASKDQNADLFWALRGGGGNFGVVTSFKFQLHPVNIVVGGPTLWHMEDAPKILKWYRDFMTGEASEDLYGFFAIMKIPPGPPFPEAIHNKVMCAILWCYTGPLENADEAFAPALRVAEPALHGVQPMPFHILQSLFDATLPPGLQWYWKADFITEISDEAIEAHMNHSDLPSLQSTMHLYPVNGAAHRVEKDATAWSYRDANWAMVIAGVNEHPGDNEKVRNWAQSYWEAIHPYSTGGAYVNMMEEEGEARIRASYRDNYDHLQKIKRKYDPENLFRVNQNIKP